MSVNIKLDLNQELFLRDPQDSKLGKSILKNGIHLINEIGFECFTFKKLAKRIDSTEASMYRYFENKHMFLLYLMCWYWEWKDYLIDTSWRNLKSSEEKLKSAIHCLADASLDEFTPDYMSIRQLHEIIIAESPKSYHTRKVDTENKKGIFLAYKELAEKLVGLFNEINPNYPYPRVLASTLLEMAHEQVFFAKHLPRLTDIKVSKDDYSQVEKTLEHMAFTLLKG